MPSDSAIAIFDCSLKGSKGGFQARSLCIPKGNFKVPLFGRSVPCHVCTCFVGSVSIVPDLGSLIAWRPARAVVVH